MNKITHFLICFSAGIGLTIGFTSLVCAEDTSPQESIARWVFDWHRPNGSQIFHAQLRERDYRVFVSPTSQSLTIRNSKTARIESQFELSPVIGGKSIKGFWNGGDFYGQSINQNRQGNGYVNNNGDKWQASWDNDINHYMLTNTDTQGKMQGRLTASKVNNVSQLNGFWKHLSFQGSNEPSFSYVRVNDSLTSTNLFAANLFEMADGRRRLYGKTKDQFFYANTGKNAYSGYLYDIGSNQLRGHINYAKQGSHVNLTGSLDQDNVAFSVDKKNFSALWRRGLATEFKA